jgi:hypothetical protein
MNNLIALNKETFEIIFDKVLQKHSMYNSKEFNQNLYTNIIDLIKEIEKLNHPEYYVLKLDGKIIIYRKSLETKIAILLICEKNSIKRKNLEDLSKVYLAHVEKYLGNNFTRKQELEYKSNETTLEAIETLTVKFIELLRKNKLYAKFIYYNYNPNVNSSINYKKTKLESTSVILYNSNKDNDKL